MVEFFGGIIVGMFLGILLASFLHSASTYSKEEFSPSEDELNKIKRIEDEDDGSKVIKIKYFDKEIDKLEKYSNGDLIDLRTAEHVEMKAGEYKVIPLGVGMILPDGYKADVYPRSSTYKNFGIILANSVGKIDNSFSGDTDQWMFPAIALRDTVIPKNSRICQFEITKIHPPIEFMEVEMLNKDSRGGIGSTGV